MPTPRQVSTITGSEFIGVLGASTNSTLVKATAARLYEVTISNVSGTALFFKLYNKATAPTVGTDVPVLTIPVAIGASVTIEFGAVGKSFGLGLGYGATAAAAASDTANVVAGTQISGTYA